MNTSANIYPFKTKPYDHQLKAFEDTRLRKCFAFLTEMGTGKSKMMIDTAAFQFDDNAIDAWFIVAPKGVYANWHDIELPKHMPDHVKYDSALWSSVPRKEQRQQMLKVFEAPGPLSKPEDWHVHGANRRLKIFIMNVEALSTKKGQDAAFTFLKRFKGRVRWDIDESTTIKNPAAKRTKAIMKLSKDVKIKRIATGSPITRNPLDLYSQCAFLDPGLLGFTSYYSFRNRYAVMIDMDMGGRRFKKITGFKNLVELQERLQAFSLRLTKKECLDLPEKIYTTRTVELTPEQKKIYAQMRDECIAILDNGEIITAQNVLTQILRLHQVVCGNIEENSISNNRLNDLMDVLEETDGKVIIWATFRRNIQEIMAAITKRFGDNAAVSYYGGTDKDERKRAVSEFQDPRSSVRYFVGNPQTGGYGLTLTEANTVVYYSNSYNLEHRLQSEDRPHRIGQLNPVTYIDFVSPGTIDEIIVQALKQKKSIADIVIDNWREIM